MRILSDEFVGQYANQVPNFGPLGWVTYVRTYARQIEALDRVEQFHETAQRVLEGNFQLERRHLLSIGEFEQNLKYLSYEAEDAYKKMFELKWLPPGRGLWCSGVETGDKNGTALTNCYYVDIKPINNNVAYPFKFAMDVLMLGAGIGYGVSRNIIKDIPAVNHSVQLWILCDGDHPNVDEVKPDTGIDSSSTLIVEDSREGWIAALEAVINASFSEEYNYLLIDVSRVRAKGMPIKGFGGTASGPGPLAEMLRDINAVLNHRKGCKLTDVDCVDIMTLIGRCVVAGNVRRSAQLSLGDSGSTNFINMKNSNDSDKVYQYYMEHDPIKKQELFGDLTHHDQCVVRNRWASNNSVLVDSDFDVFKIAESIVAKGEPGFCNLDLMQNYGRMIDGRKEGIDAGVTGTNPCSEISLTSYENCNLSEVFMPNCESLEEMKEVAVMAYRYAKRVTLSYYEWPETAAVVKKNRRIGVSLSGGADWLVSLAAKLNVPLFIENTKTIDDIDSFQPNRPTYTLHPDLYQEAAYQLNELYMTVKKEDYRYSDDMDICNSIKLTTVKPSGTISLLAGTSQGVHFPYGEYLIRRIQFQKDNPLLDQLRASGIFVRPATSTPNACIAEFPIKAKSAGVPGFLSAGDVPVEVQFQIQELFQKYWADNQVSCTISFKLEDAELLPHLIDEYSTKLKSTSMLPYIPTLKKQYPDLPNEPITLEEYEALKAKIPIWPGTKAGVAIKLETDDISNEECENGVCPIR